MKTILYIATASLLTICCKKDKDDPESIFQTEETYPDYGMLKPGNYWIYQQVVIDTNGSEIPTQTFDSCFVEKDTIINNRTYAKMYRPSLFNPLESYLYLRDSLHYIVDVSGGIQFSSKDTGVFTSRYVLGSNDTICYVEKRMKDVNLGITVPAGTFLTSDARETFYLSPPFNQWGSERKLHIRYAENVGIVKETLPFFLSLPGATERQLVRYFVQ